MPNPLDFHLTPEERRELEHVRDHHNKAYLRERAAALLKIAAGQSGLRVARHGLHKPRDPDTIYSWLRRYQAGGVAGLAINSGRGRPPVFSPKLARPSDD